MDTDKNRNVLPPTIDATFIRPVDLKCDSHSDLLQSIGKVENSSAYEVEDHGFIYIMPFVVQHENRAHVFRYLFAGEEPLLWIPEGGLAINMNFDPSIQFEMAYNYMRKHAERVQ